MPRPMKLLGGFGAVHVVATVVALACLHCGHDPEKPSVSQVGGAAGESSGKGGSDSQMGGSRPQGDAGRSSAVGGGAAGQASVGEMGGAGGEGPIVVEGAHHGFVFAEVRMPVSNTEANAMAFDLNGDGKSDNQFGRAIVALSMQGLEINQAAAAATQDGSAILLADLQAPSLTSAKGAGLMTFYGADPVPMPCASVNDCGHHLDGTGTFSVAAATPHVVVTPGRIAAAVFNGQGGELPVQFGFAGGVLELVLHDAHAELTNLSTDGFTGRLGGVIPQDQVDGQIYRAIWTGAASFVSRDCTGGVAPVCGCQVGSVGRTYLDLMDTDHDCALSLAEVKANPLFSAIFAVDLDTDGDQKPDAMSCAFAVSAKKGTFNLP